MSSDDFSRTAPASGARRASQLTSQQVGFAVAALVAFLGITYVGPALTRHARMRAIDKRIARQVRETRRQARKVRGRIGRRLRRLGGGPVWR
jgi:hypothetical protein